MTVDAFASVLSVAIFVSGFSLLAYPLIAVFFFVRSTLMKTDVSCVELSISLLFVAGVIASAELPSRFFVVFYSVAFITSLGLLMRNFIRLFPEKKGTLRRFFAMQVALGAMFVEIIRGLSMLNPGLDAVDYLSIIAVMIVLITVNLVVYMRNVNFSRSLASVLQGAIVTLMPIAACCWIVIVDWYGLVLLYFCYCIWIIQATLGIKKVVSGNKFGYWVAFSLMAAWILIAGTVSYHNSEPWIS